MSFKKCQVVMLPTNEKATIFKILNIDKLCIGANEIPNFGDRHQNQHLYITSEDKIKKDDWCLDVVNNKVLKADHDVDYEQNHVFKIIATTSSLTKEMDSISFGKYQEPLLQPSQAFIEKYVEKYNKGDQITDVLVEYVDSGHEDWCERTDQPIWIEKLVPYINHKDHTIIIKKVKDSYTKKELLLILTKFGLDVYEEYTKNKTMYDFSEEWIEENI